MIVDLMTLKSWTVEMIAGRIAVVVVGRISAWIVVVARMAVAVVVVAQPVASAVAAVVVATSSPCRGQTCSCVVCGQTYSSSPGVKEVTFDKNKNTPEDSDEKNSCRTFKVELNSSKNSPTIFL